MKKKRVIIVTAGFFPGKKYGGPPVSVDNFCTLMADYDCFIITKDHDLGDKTPYQNIEDGWNKRSNCCVRYLKDSDYNYKVFLSLVDEIQPDILYLQGIFQSCVLPCLRIAKKRNIKVVLAPRGELCKGAIDSSKLKFFKKKLYLAYLRFFGFIKRVVLQSTSQEETLAIVKHLRVKCDVIYQTPNIPSVSSNTLIHSSKIKDKARVVFLSRIHPKKNLLLAIEILIASKGKIDFDIYGPIEDEKYWERCLATINNTKKDIRIQYKGLVSHEDVGHIFSNYDLFLFPTHSENYGHVIIESLLSGTPVIISDRTPWNDLKDYEAGSAIPLNNFNEFVSQIEKIVVMGEQEHSFVREQAKKYAFEKCNIQEIKEKYSILFESSFNG